jgi:putative transposase
MKGATTRRVCDPTSSPRHSPRRSGGEAHELKGRPSARRCSNSVTLVPVAPDTPIRKKLKRRQYKDGARFLTFSCYQRLKLMDNPLIRDAFARNFQAAHERFGFIIIAWVVMPEHVHLMLRPRPGDSDIVAPLAWLKRETAKQIIARWRLLRARILTAITDDNDRPHFWQRGGGYDRNIWSEDEMTEKVGYIHRNPVTRRLVERSTDWEWSSARWYAGERDSLVKVDRTAW